MLGAGKEREGKTETGGERKRGDERKEEKKSGRLRQGPTDLGPRPFLTAHPTLGPRSDADSARCNGIGNALRFVIGIRSRVFRSLARSLALTAKDAERSYVTFAKDEIDDRS